jgi:hypothetical protein
MSRKNIILLSTLLALILVLFVYPSIDNRSNAGPSQLKQNAPALVTVHQIAVSSEAVIAHYFGKSTVEKIMKQPGCVSVRMYYGKRADGRKGFIFVGVDKNGKDLTPVVIAGPTDACPPLCNE